MRGCKPRTGGDAYARRAGLGRGGLLIGAALVAGILASWYRPWADSTLSASVSIRTDGTGVAVERRVSKVFSKGGHSRPSAVVEIDLSSLQGELALLEVGGDVGRRGDDEGSTGYVAVSADVISGEGVTTVEFGGWRPRSEMPFPTGPIGPQAYEVTDETGRRFCYARKGCMWHVLRPPPNARIRVRLRPVLYEDIEGQPRFALLPVSASARRGTLVGRHSTGGERPPDIFIYLVDATRADHLGCYGYERDTSPHVDEFAADATLYEAAHASSSWTRPSVASLLTGLHPCVHGAVDESAALPAWPTLLSEALRDAGYATWCVTANPNIDEASGFNQGYDGFMYRSDADARWVNAQIQRALDRCDRCDRDDRRDRGDRRDRRDGCDGCEAERPMFLFAHVMEPHAPYAPSRESFARFDRRGEGRCPGWEEALSELECEAPEERARGLEHLIDRYDAEIFDADRAFGRFLDMLRRAGRFENALIVFLADHGESLREHGGMYHGHTLAVQELHVPLIVRYPGGRHAGVRVGHRVGLTDIFPAAMAEAGVRPDLRQSTPGRDLSPTASPDPVASRMYYQLSPLRPELPTLLGVLDEDGYKRVIAPCEPDRREPKRLGLWDTKVDPDEKRNVVDSMPVRAAYGEQLIAGWLAGRLRDRESAPQEAPRLVEATEERRRELRALGYLQ